VAKRPTPRRHRWWWAAGVVLLVAAGLIIVLWPARPAPRTLPPARARQYLAFDACLFTGTQGLADPAAQPVWAGMQDASLATRAKVSYLAVTGPQTVGNAVPYTNTLLARQCNVVVAVGQSQVDAIYQTAPSHPGATFVVVGGQSGANVTALPTGPAAEVRSSVANLIMKLVR
jgi:basic membrane lipoprotein Med (substrate-binding protein (PBP1-ABC) superfamily)